jgi:hypothetical protein
VNLVASLVVRNELVRYLKPCIEHLLEFCDKIVVLDDASDDGTAEWLLDYASAGLFIGLSPESSFYRHEGRTRDRLLALTLAQKPTHVLNLDADEFITDGPALRDLIAEQPDASAWHIPIEEVWEANDDRYLAREDGGWKTGRTLCWKVPAGRLTFPNRALACGRVPSQLRVGSARPAAVSLLHVGWLDESDRVSRHDRYVKHDGGRFHRGAHLASILWPREKVELVARPWPQSLAPWKDAILEHASVKA